MAYPGICYLYQRELLLVEQTTSFGRASANRGQSTPCEVLQLLGEIWKNVLTYVAGGNRELMAGRKRRASNLTGML